mmetsp:Transcript_7099/g.10732  ORF Transcript_7099/g.10732 Transcript_7099/m.10732 type:complete len:263 (-) Transcript_7099:53-841(-)
MMLSFGFFVRSVDPSALGRPDKASLSDQTLMELLVQDVLEKSEFIGSDGAFKDVSDWDRVTTDENERVTNIQFDALSSTGDFHLEWLPLSVLVCNVEGNGWDGTIEWSALPAGLRIFSAFDNKLHGSLPIPDVPRAMWVLLLGRNFLSGTLDLTLLPPDLEMLELSYNQFFGTISLVNIQKRITAIDFDRLDVLERSGEKTDGEWHFGCDFCNSGIEGDIQVFDVSLVEDMQVFSRLKSQQLVDVSGNTRDTRDRRKRSEQL